MRQAGLGCFRGAEGVECSDGLLLGHETLLFGGWAGRGVSPGRPLPALSGRRNCGWDDRVVEFEAELAHVKPVGCRL